MFVGVILILSIREDSSGHILNVETQHPPQPLEYYEEALAEFDDEQPVIVFSDSPEWVKEQEFFASDRFMISEPEEVYGDGSFTPYADLCLMSLCSHAIIANSSMSWWGALTYF